jgi:CheY-like chemotaxis protein
VGPDANPDLVRQDRHPDPRAEKWRMAGPHLVSRIEDRIPTAAETCMLALLEDRSWTVADLDSRPGVLIVDEEPTVLELLHQVLEGHGFETWLAFSPDDAVLLYQQNASRIHVVLTSLGMFESLGPRVVALLRALPSPVPVCFTAGGADSHPGEYAPLGAAWVFSKPFDLADLVSVLRRFAPCPRV